MEGEGDQLRSFFPLVVRRSAPLQVCNSLRKADGSARLGGMSLGLSAFASLRTRKSPKSPSQQKSAHLRSAVDTALSAETSKTSRNDIVAQQYRYRTGAEPAKSARNPLRNSLRKSLLPIVQLAAPHSQLRCSSPVTKRGGSSPATPRSPLRNSLRKSLLPIAQLAAPHDQLRRSPSPATPLRVKQITRRPSGQKAPGG
jgi:hypothetical protein